MNPPSALVGAMSRDRKPFTYTPGGLDLSEIKSERMAKRLMRNAMNQGLPELPQSVQSPPTPTTPIAVPNYNCLPVQVFPTFNLPANPKSLLRTRSTPDRHRELAQPSSQNVNSLKRNGAEQFGVMTNNNSQKQSQTVQNNSNNNIPATELDRKKVPNIDSNSSRTMYGSDSYTNPILPEISYEAEYFHAIPKVDGTTGTLSNCFSVLNENEDPKTATVDKTLANVNKDTTIEPSSECISVPIFETKTAEDNAGTDDDEKREVKTVKKQQVKKESKVETQNGDHNGDVNTEAEMTVKIPSKKSSAKTETKVEVSTKTLPDGSTEETKVTTTRTTIDGRTEIKTKTERKIIPKALEIEEEEEEEEEEENGNVVVKEVDDDGKENNIETKTVVKKQETPVTQQSNNVVKKEERSESTTTSTKKVVVVQQSTKNEENKDEEEEEEEEEDEEEEEQTEVKPVEKTQPASKSESKKDEEEEEEDSKEEKVEEKKPEIKSQETHEEEEEEEEEKEEEETEAENQVTKSETKKEDADEEKYEETEESEKKAEQKVEKQTEPEKKEDDEESEYTEEEYESEKEETKQTAQESKPKEEEKPKLEEEKGNQGESAQQTETKVPLREPSIPLEKVEDVEIKPIGLQTLSKTHTESTEITTSASDKPSAIQSTQTEYNRIENIVTVNRTTKTLDHTYEQLTQQGIPTVKTYFAPEREKVSTSPQPAKPYQPAYQSPSQPERRHSLLLERISMERQMPSEIYQNINNQSYEQQRQYSQEPQSEVVNVSNVKPSTITNQEWFQQSRKENVIYNNVVPSAASAPSQQWTQPQAQRQPQPQSYIQPQQSYAQPQPQTYSQPQPQPQYQPSYVDNNLQNTSKFTSNTYQQSTYTDFSPQPSSWAPNYGTSLPSVNTPSNQYSYSNKDTTDTYQKPQQYSSSYVPPPWEQDPSYVAPDLPTQNYYQPPPSANTFSPGAQPAWKPAQPSSKFTKPPPKAYIPPAPNQSFVKPVNTAAPSKLPGRKTYYSEYERRYISVPESTYIPGETKHQPQPDPSPQYYYDNNEPSEKTEHQWRKELREFTEKSTQSQHTDQSCIRPPWEDEAKYAKAQTYQPTPSWSQTLKPQTWRERSFESEYVGSKTNTQTLGRSRPLSSYGTSNVETSLPDRPRGMSVDRYNPSSYQAPLAAEHGPVQTHIHNPQAQVKNYHNPNVPAYHSRGSAEPREQPVPIPQARHWADRTTPIQSRSFKYLQWITGTED